MNHTPYIPQRRAWLATLAAVLLSACRPVRWLNAVIPAGQMRVRRDLAYGPHPRQRLDVYQPRTPPPAPSPLLIFFYGGSWDSGDKQDYLFVAEAFVSLGYVVVIADYRLYPEVKFPALMQDPAAVVQWVQQHAFNWQADANRLFLMGHSAGAHLAMMLSLAPQFLQAVGLQPAIIAGTVGLAGPYDFLPLTSDRLRAIFAPPAQEILAQPIHFARGDAPPLLLMTGMKDDVVWPRNAVNLAHAVAAQGGDVCLKTYARYDHVDMVAKLARPLRGDASLLNDIRLWMQAHGG